MRLAQQQSKRSDRVSEHPRGLSRERARRADTPKGIPAELPPSGAYHRVRGALPNRDFGKIQYGAVSDRSATR